ncbi:MAG: serpin family protein [Acidimicrobiales bacterium]
MSGPAVDRRRFLAALTAVPALAAVLQACSDDLEPSGDGSGHSGTAGGELRSETARTAAGPTLAAPLATAIEAFGIDLYRRLAAAAPADNLVVSPTSIALALAMAAAGAAGTTLDEMLATLHAVELDLHASANALDTALAARNGDQVTLSLAQATWLQDRMTVMPAFLDTLAADYGSGVRTVDFEADPDAARTEVNEWVDDRTEGRIPELLAPGTVDELTRFVLVNAVYLKALWADPFDPSITRDAPFTTAGGDTADVPTMVKQTEFAYASGDGWQAVELPYAGDELAMLLFLPETDFLPTFEEIFLVTDATQYLEPRLVRLFLPRWDTSASFDLADQLSALGMPTAFTDAADFTGITTDEPLQIGAVIHQANITVGEDGTEAAAATAVVGVAGSAAPTDEPIELVFDRPFVFVLRDRPTGAVLFVGRVADPRG